jgi:adenine-specific DNA-methyltransferase
LAKSGTKSILTGKARGAGKVAETYTHSDETFTMRPEIGTQPQFRKKKAPKTYRYDTSLSPALEWDGQTVARELGEWLLALIERASAQPDDTFKTPREFRAADGTVLVTV